MSFLDYIKNFLNLNKNGTQIIAKDLDKIYGNNDAFEVGLYHDKVPVSGKTVVIQINGVEYKRDTDDNGIAKLNIGLQPGKYYTTVSFAGDDIYKRCSGSAVVYVNPVLKASDLTMDYGNGKFEVKTVSSDGSALVNVPVTLSVNGKDYVRSSDGNGVASLKIGLNPGSYPIRISSVNVTGNKTITVKKLSTRMEGTDMVKAFSDKGTYQCAVYDRVGRVAGEVVISVNGKDYVRSADSEGLYKLNIGLQPGDYKIIANFNGDLTHVGSSVTNTIKVNADPEKPKCSNPYSSSPFHLTQGGGMLGQKTAYSCGPHSLMQAYYNLTGIDTSETELMRACGTTTAGTGHPGLQTGLAYLNKKYGTNITMEWKDFSDIGYTKLGELLCDSDSTIFWHELYRGQWGHYSLANKINTNTSLFNVLNSLGSRCSYPAYCGYQETRGFSTQKSYWGGISQPSICILRKR